MKSIFPAFLAGCLWVDPCLAQDDMLVADEVVVTANRFEEPQSGHPLGTQVITRSQIEASNAATISDALTWIGGVHTRDNSGHANMQLDVRGFGINGDQNTLVLVNGRRISEIDLQPANLAAIPLSSVERIEILHSGGAVMYGGGATGGTINIITRTPQPGSRTGSLQGGAGSYDAYSAEAAVELAGDELGFGLTARRYDTENYRRNNANRQDTMNGTLHWSGDKDRLTFAFGRDTQDARLPGALSQAQIAADRRATAFPDDFASLDTEFASATWMRFLADVEFGADASYRRNESRGFVSGGQSNYDNRALLFSPRAKISGQLWDMKNVVVLGADWEDWDYDSLTIFPGFDADSISTQQTAAAYVQNTLHLGSGTAVTVGARNQRSRTEIRTRDTFTPSSTTAQTVHPRAYELALWQALGETFNLYIKAANSFRLATVDENRGQAQPLEPQSSRDREVTLEYAAGGRRMRLSAYRLSVSNEIHFMFIPGGFFGLFGSNVNLPPTRHEGVELEGQTALLPNLQVIGRLEYRRARFREGMFGGVDVSGNDVPLVPERLASLMMAWQPADGWNVTGAMRYVGEQRFDNDQSNAFATRMPAYTVMDLKASRSLHRWLLSAQVNNLFAEEYFSYGILNGAGTSFSAYPAAEQSFFLTAEYRFGP